MFTGILALIQSPTSSTPFFGISFFFFLLLGLFGISLISSVVLLKFPSKQMQEEVCKEKEKEKARGQGQRKGGTKRRRKKKRKKMKEAGFVRWKIC